MITLVSSISTKNVLFPSRILSDAPRRVKTLSTGVKMKLSAGTKHPIYARIIAKHVYLISVDLPPILGPVIRSDLAGSFFVHILVVFGMNCFLFFPYYFEFFFLTPG